jgi:hypothetical protein
MVATGRTCDLSPATRMARPVPLRSPRRFKTTDLRCDGPAPHGVFTEWFRLRLAAATLGRLRIRSPRLASEQP